MTYEALKKLVSKTMYRDKVTVLRQMSTLDDEGADVYDLQEVYSDVPCKLSQYGKDISSEQTDRGMNMITDLRLCCNPDLEILPNDVLFISNSMQEFNLRAGKAFKYPTHQEISVRREGEEA